MSQTDRHTHTPRHYPIQRGPGVSKIPKEISPLAIHNTQENVNYCRIVLCNLLGKLLRSSNNVTTLNVETFVGRNFHRDKPSRMSIANIKFCRYKLSQTPSIFALVLYFRAVFIKI